MRYRLGPDGESLWSSSNGIKWNPEAFLCVDEGCRRWILTKGNKVSEEESRVRDGRDIPEEHAAMIFFSCREDRMLIEGRGWIMVDK